METSNMCEFESTQRFPNPIMMEARKGSKSRKLLKCLCNQFTRKLTALLPTCDDSVNKWKFCKLVLLKIVLHFTSQNQWQPIYRMPVAKHTWHQILLHTIWFLIFFCLKLSSFLQALKKLKRCVKCFWKMKRFRPKTLCLQITVHIIFVRNKYVPSCNQEF